MTVPEDTNLSVAMQGYQMWMFIFSRQGKYREFT